jgi:hypothetical protein
MPEPDSSTKTFAIIGADTGVLGSLLGITALSWDIYKWRNTEKRKLLIKVRSCKKTFPYGQDSMGGIAFRQENSACLEVSNPTKFEAVVDRIEFVTDGGAEDFEPDSGSKKVLPSNREELIIRGEFTDGYFVVYDVLGNSFKSNRI